MLASIPAIVPQNSVVSRRLDAPLARLLLGHSGLCRRQPGDGHPVRRTTDVVQPDLMAEHDAGGVASVFPADSDFQLLAGLATTRHADFHQPPDAVLIDRLERIAADDIVLAIVPY